MNAHLRYVPDGSGAESDDAVEFATIVRSFLARSGPDTKRSSDRGEIWWPFAIHDHDGLKKVTHLPSGYALGPYAVTVEQARALIQELRALGLDWEFTTPKGPKWDAVKALSRPTLEKYGVISEKATA